MTNHIGFGSVDDKEASSVAWPVRDRQFETTSAGNSWLLGVTSC